MRFSEVNFVIVCYFFFYIYEFTNFKKSPLCSEMCIRGVIKLLPHTSSKVFRFYVKSSGKPLKCSQQRHLILFSCNSRKRFTAKVHLNAYGSIICGPYNIINLIISLFYIYEISNPACDCFARARPKYVLDLIWPTGQVPQPLSRNTLAAV